jgi:hypothetical protein
MGEQMFTKIRLKPAALWIVCVFFAFWAGPSTQLSAQEENTPPSIAESPLCEIKIQGGYIERLVLSHKNQNRPENDITFDRPGQSMQLPAGEYHVKQIHLQGGYTCDLPIIPGISGPNAERYGWFTLNSTEPYVLHIGPPLKPDIFVFRTGQILRFSYSLLDQEGRNYTNKECNILPSFTVFRNGEVIGSGVLGRFG